MYVKVWAFDVCENVSIWMLWEQCLHGISGFSNFGSSLINSETLSGPLFSQPVNWGANLTLRPLVTKFITCLSLVLLYNIISFEEVFYNNSFQCFQKHFVGRTRARERTKLNKQFLKIHKFGSHIELFLNHSSLLLSGDATLG